MQKKKYNNMFIHPYIRLFFLISGLISTYLVQNTFVLIGYYCFVIIPLFIYAKQIVKHLRFLLIGMIPIFLSFVLLYIIILNKDNGDWLFVFAKVSKLLLYTSIFQLALIIPPENLFQTFKKWRFKGDSLLILLGTFTVWEDISLKTEKILTARFARGFVNKRTVYNKLKQFPFVLIPLLIGIIRTSNERSISWRQKNISKLIENINNSSTNYQLSINSILIFFSITWLLIGFIYILK